MWINRINYKFCLFLLCICCFIQRSHECSYYEQQKLDVSEELPLHKKISSDDLKIAQLILLKIVPEIKIVPKGSSL